MSESLLVTIDRVAYAEKPAKGEIAAITRRLQAAGPVEVAPEELAEAVANGHTWCGGCYKPSRRGWGEFIGQQLFAFDVDNDIEVVGPDGRKVRDAEGHVVKRDLRRGEEGFLDPWAALDRFRSLFGGDPLLMYPSFSFEQPSDLTQYPEKCKFRLAFDAGAMVDSEERAKDVLAKLLRAFPEADPKCVNANRLFFGSCGKAVLFTEGGPLYVQRA